MWGAGGEELPHGDGLGGLGDAGQEHGGVTTERRSVTREYEEWTYNFGPRRFMQVVTFENGRLIDVQSAGYGSE